MKAALIIGCLLALSGFAQSKVRIDTTSLTAGAVGVAYNQTLSASGGPAPFTWSLIKGTLPTGLNLNAGGTISGTPVATVNSMFTVQVEDSGGGTATEPLSINVDPAVTITTSSLPVAVAGTAYSQTLTASGGTPPFQWTVTSGSLPAGISLSTGGSLSGTPSAAGDPSFSVQVKDSNGSIDTASLTITVEPPVTISTGSLPGGTEGQAYSQTLSASGGSGTYTWTVTAGALPAGLALSSGGAISGTPSAAVSSNFTVKAVSAGSSATKNLSITINPTPAVTTASLPNGTSGISYQQSLAASGGTLPYSWAVTAGALPGSLSLSAAGSITGTPSAAGTSSFTVQVTDSAGAKATKALSIVIAPAPLTITTSSLPGGTVGAAYQQTLTASGGTGGYSWAVAGGALPASLLLSAAGSITGAPSATGTSNFTVQVTDSSGAKATMPLSIVIAPAPLTITTSSLPGGTVGAAYQQMLTASGGTGGYNWVVTVGVLPASLSLSAAGSITGTPSAAGTSSFTVQVTDSSGAKATKALSIVIAPAALTITTSSLPGGTVGTAYQQTLAASGGTGGYSWAVTTGALPASLLLSAAGSITGAPSAAGTSNFTVQVTDSSGAKATMPLSIVIAPAALTITTSSLPGGTAGTAYQQTLAASGGTGGYSWIATVGALPSGLSLTAAGSITGTPSAAGTSSFTVQVTDSSGAKAAMPLSIVIAPAQLTITTSSLPSGIAGTAYQQTLAASGGTGGYGWAVSAGAPPAGLSLSTAGNITGTPSAAGTSSFTAQVTDSSGAKATQGLSIVIAPAPLTITVSSVPSGGAGTAYQQTLAATGGTSPYSWAVTAGALPAGLLLSAGGSITGIPSAAGTSTFTAQVTDSSGAKATMALTIVIAPPPLTITTSSLPSGTAGTAYQQTLAASGGTGGYGWVVTAGALPLGLSLGAGGSITGTPSAAGTSSFTAQVTDSALEKAVGAFAITINPALTVTTAPALATGSAGAPYSQKFTALGGIPPYTWTISGILPAGLSLAATTGVLSGTPTQVGAFPITVQVTDSALSHASGSYSLQVVSGLAIATPPVLPGATVGASYSTALQAAGGSSPYQWIVTAGSLPGGLNFSGTGQISGAATSSGAFTFTAQVTDANSNRATKQFTLAVAGGISVTSASLPAGATQAPYAQTLAATGGTPPYLWSLTAGSLPNGLSLQAATGTLEGTPTATGDFTFTVTVTDANSVTAQKQFTLSIGTAVIFTTPASLPGATAGASYSFTMLASGGQPPYSWSITQGALPDGLSLNAASGSISGTAGTPGTFNFTVQVSDAANTTATRVQSIVVGLPDVPAISINGFSGSMQPLQQPPVNITLSNPFPVPITGTVSLSFAPGGPNPLDDPSIQFSTGGRTATFTIPANATQATFTASQFAVQTGSVAGTISLNVVSLQAAGSSLPIPNGLLQTVQINPGPPVIGAIALVQISGGIQVQITGITDTRELTQVTVAFQPTSGTSLQTSQITVPLTTAANAWFQSSSAAPFGGQFSLTLPFTFTGSVSLSSVSAVLSNTVGDSAAAAANN